MQHAVDEDAMDVEPGSACSFHVHVVVSRRYCCMLTGASLYAASSVC